MHVTRFLNSNRNRLLLFAAACVFVFTQTLDLQHSHSGDLSSQVDCEVCLKLGNQNGIAVAKLEIPQLTLTVAYLQESVVGSVSRAIRSYSPRAPPRSFS